MLFMDRLSALLLLIFVSSPLYGGEASLYDFSWLDPDKEVFVLQNRKFRKAGKIHLNGGFGITTSGPFVNATSFQGRLGVFLREEWGVEGVYAVNSGKENDTAAAVRNPGGSGSFPFRRIVTDYFGVMLIWSPFYAKINTFNSVVYLDWMFGAGYVKVNEENNAREFSSQGVETEIFKEGHSGFIWQTTFNVFLTQVFNLRFDFTSIHYKGDVPRQDAPRSGTEDWYYNYDLTMSLGARF